jgi:hypothetical protein
MLNAFKEFLRDYTTPPDKVLVSRVHGVVYLAVSGVESALVGCH